jgi:hypothetical protein
MGKKCPKINQQSLTVSSRVNFGCVASTKEVE